MNQNTVIRDSETVEKLFDIVDGFFDMHDLASYLDTTHAMLVSTIKDEKTWGREFIAETASQVGYINCLLAKLYQVISQRECEINN